MLDFKFDSTSDRERELQELKREVNNVIDKKRKLEQELGRLKQHLVAIEESGTQDALAFEEREKEIKKKLQVSQSIMVSLLFLNFILSQTNPN
jgi:predicted  nucleic acid-binding Zn-ribbon protein